MEEIMMGPKNWDKTVEEMIKLAEDIGPTAHALDALAAAMIAIAFNSDLTDPARTIRTTIEFHLSGE
jgi:hypothetical protein